MAENKVQLTKADRWSVCLRSTFLQGSWNYERMQNGGWCYAMIPAIKRLYTTKEEQSAALKRHLEFFNTQPYVAAPILGVTLALEEDRANGAPVEDAAIQGVKVGMMGPLAGVGDPVFWFTARPILAALGASFALTGSILGPIIFFVFWNILRMAFLWYTQEFGYNVGTAITKNLSGGLLGKITALPAGSEGIHQALSQYASGVSLEQTITAVTTLQDNLNSLIPGLMPLLLTLLCMRLLKKNISPIMIILALFVIGIVLHLPFIGLL